MAASNWDTLAVDQDSKPQQGQITSPAGVTVRIYKNWVYIADPQAWRKGSFSRPTVASVNQGSLQYRDVYIEASRGPQNGVFTIVVTGGHKPAGIMVGCGVYGYTEDGEYIGVAAESVKFLQDWLLEREPPEDIDQYTIDYWGIEEWEARKATPEGRRKIQEARDTAWVWPDEVRNITLAEATRYNQGDAILGPHLEQTAEDRATPVGQAAETILSRTGWPGLPKNGAKE